MCGACGTDSTVLPPAPDGGSPPIDGGSGLVVRAPEPPTVPAEPEPAAMPSFLPCPDGWRALDDDTCDPWPAGGEATCASDEMHLPGQPGCARIGAACPTGVWPEDLPATGVLYVRPSTVTGDGTEASPYGTIAEALANTSGGETIALAKGTYDETIASATTARIAGACVKETSWVSTATTPAIDVQAGRIDVENLTLGGVRVAEQGSVTLDGVVIASAIGTGVDVVGGTASIERSAIVDTARAPDNTRGFALRAQRGGTIDAHGVRMSRNRVATVVVLTGSSVSLEDTVAEDTVVVGDIGLGAFVGGGSRLELARSLFRRHALMGILAGDGSVVTAEDSIFRELRGAPLSGDNGRAIGMEDGELVLRRVLIEDAEEAGLVVFTSTAALEDVMIRGVAVEPASQIRGIGILAQIGAVVTATRTAVIDATTVGVTVIDSRFEATDLVVVAPKENAVIGGGRGVEVSEGALRLSRVLVDDVPEIGMTISSTKSVAELEDVVIRDAGRQGLRVQFGASLRLTRARLERTAIEALSALETSDLVVTDLTIVDTLRDENGESGYGVAIDTNSTCRIERAHVERSGFAGLISSMGARIDATDVTVVDGTGTGDERAGVGVSAQLGGAVSIRRGLIDNNRSVGLLAVAEGELMLEDVTVLRTRAGRDDIFGRGISSEDRASVTGARIRLEDNREATIAVAEGATVELSDVEIIRTLERTCAQTTCSGNGHGTGAIVFLDGYLSLDRFRVRDNALLGLQLVRGGEADLSNGEVSGNPIGVNVQTEGFDLDRLLNDVTFVDNDRNFDGKELPVPESVNPL